MRALELLPCGEWRADYNELIVSKLSSAEIQVWLVAALN